MRAPARLGLVVLLTITVCAMACTDGRSHLLPYDSERALHLQFSGEKALAQAMAVTALGPRPAGSEALEQSRKWIEAELAASGWAVSRQPFEDQTPHGNVSFVNLRVRFPSSNRDAGETLWKRPVEGLLLSHYDTKKYEGITFVGANDPGSSVGALLEAARVLGQRPEMAQRLELVFFDGEEAFIAFTATDGLYGSRYYAKQVRAWPTEARPQWGVLMDLVGDQDLKIRIPSDSPESLAKKLFFAAEELGYRKHFGYHPTAITDDHVPLNNAGIPTVNVIDFDYPYWHTPADTVDKLSAESLEIVGRTVLLLVEKYLVGGVATASATE